MSNEETKVVDLEQQMAEQAANVAAEKGKPGRKAKAEVATEAKEKPAEVLKKRDGMTGRMVDIMIHNGEGSLGKKPVDVSINGFRYKIKRNVRVNVPIEVVEVLKNAIRFEYTVDGDTETRSEVPRHPMSVFSA